VPGPDAGPGPQQPPAEAVAVVEASQAISFEACRVYGLSRLCLEGSPPRNDLDQVVSSQHVKGPGHCAARHAVMTCQVRYRRQRLSARPLTGQHPPTQVGFHPRTRQLRRSGHQAMIERADCTAHAEQADCHVCTVSPGCSVYHAPGLLDVAPGLRVSRLLGSTGQ
jgi:hypothetical protein